MRVSPAEGMRRVGKEQGPRFKVRHQIKTMVGKTISHDRILEKLGGGGMSRLWQLCRFTLALLVPTDAQSFGRRLWNGDR